MKQRQRSKLNMPWAQVPAFGKFRRQQQVPFRSKLKYEYRMMTTAFTGRLPIMAADPMQPQVRCAISAAAAASGCRL